MAKRKKTEIEIPTEVTATPEEITETIEDLREKYGAQYVEEPVPTYVPRPAPIEPEPVVPPLDVQIAAQEAEIVEQAREKAEKERLELVSDIEIEQAYELVPPRIGPPPTPLAERVSRRVMRYGRVGRDIFVGTAKGLTALTAEDLRRIKAQQAAEAAAAEVRQVPTALTIRRYPPVAAGMPRYGLRAPTTEFKQAGSRLSKGKQAVIVELLTSSYPQIYNSYQAMGYTQSQIVGALRDYYPGLYESIKAEADELMRYY